MKQVILAILMIFLPALASNVNAIAVASDFLENNTLVLVQGSSALYSIRLQNPTDNQIGIKLDYDETFMKVIDYKEVYILQPRETGYKILFNVTAPKKPGLYSLGYTVGEVSLGGGSGVGLLLKISKNFNLKVIEDPNKFHFNFNYVIYAAMIMAFLMYFFKKKRAEKHSRRKSRKFL